MRDNYDDEDDDLSIRHETPFPSSVRAAGVIWIVIGALILFNALVFLFELSLPRDHLELFFRTYGLVPANYSNVDWTDPAVPTAWLAIFYR